MCTPCLRSPSQPEQKMRAHEWVARWPCSSSPRWVLEVGHVLNVYCTCCFYFSCVLSLSPSPCFRYSSFSPTTRWWPNWHISFSRETIAWLSLPPFLWKKLLQARQQQAHPTPNIVVAALGVVCVASSHRRRHWWQASPLPLLKPDPIQLDHWLYSHSPWCYVTSNIVKQRKPMVVAAARKVPARSHNPIWKLAVMHSCSD